MYKTQVLFSKNGGYMNFLKEAPKNGKGKVHTKSVNGCRGSYKKFWVNHGTRDGTRSETNQTEFGLGIKLGGGLFGNRKSRAIQLKSITAKDLDIEIYGDPHITNPYFVDDDDSINTVKWKLLKKEQFLESHPSFRFEPPMRVVTVVEMPLVGTNELEEFIKRRRQREMRESKCFNRDHSEYDINKVPENVGSCDPQIERSVYDNGNESKESSSINPKELPIPLPKLWRSFLSKLSTMIHLHLKIQQNGQEAGLILATNFTHASINLNRVEKEILLMMANPSGSQNSLTAMMDNSSNCDNSLYFNEYKSEGDSSIRILKTQERISTFFNTFARTVLEDLLSQHYKHVYAPQNSTTSASEGLKRLGLKISKPLIAEDGKSSCSSDSGFIISKSEVAKERKGCVSLFSMRNKALLKSNNDNTMAKVSSNCAGIGGVPSVKRRPALSLPGMGSSKSKIKNTENDKLIYNEKEGVLPTCESPTMMVSSSSSFESPLASSVSVGTSSRDMSSDVHSEPHHHQVCHITTSGVPLFYLKKGGIQQVLQKCSSRTNTTNVDRTACIERSPHDSHIRESQSIDGGLKTTTLNPFLRNKSNYFTDVYLGRKYPGSTQIAFSTCMYILPSYNFLKKSKPRRSSVPPRSPPSGEYGINWNTRPLTSTRATPITTLMSTDTSLSFKTLLHWTTLNNDARHCPTDLRSAPLQYGSASNKNESSLIWGNPRDQSITGSMNSTMSSSSFSPGQSWKISGKIESVINPLQVSKSLVNTKNITTRQTPIEIVNVIRCISPTAISTTVVHHNEEREEISLRNELASEDKEENNIKQNQKQEEIALEYEMRETLSITGARMSSSSNVTCRTFRAETIHKALSTFEEVSHQTLEELRNNNICDTGNNNRRLTRISKSGINNKRKIIIRSSISKESISSGSQRNHGHLEELTTSINDEVLDPVAKYLKKNYGIRPVREDAWGLLRGLVDRSSNSIPLRDKDREEARGGNGIYTGSVVHSKIDNDDSGTRMVMSV